MKTKKSVVVKQSVAKTVVATAATTDKMLAAELKLESEYVPQFSDADLGCLEKLSDTAVISLMIGLQKDKTSVADGQLVCPFGRG